MLTAISTGWKVSKYGVISGPYFPVFGLNKERYGVTQYLDNFHAVFGARSKPYFGQIQLKV